MQPAASSQQQQQQQQQEKSFSLKGSSLVFVLCLALCGAHLTSGADQNSSSSGRRGGKSDPPPGVNCTGHMKTIDRCSSLATYSYSSPLNPYPDNARALKGSCDRIAEGVACIKTHIKCLSSLSRSALNAYANARARHSKKLCSNPNEARFTDFWRSAECIKRNKKEPVMVASEKKLISTIHMIALNKSMKWDDRFHQACCTADKYKATVLKDLGPECDQFKTTTEEMVDSMVGELLEAVCPAEDRLKEICLKLPTLIVRQVSTISLTSAALELVISLSDDQKQT